MFDTKKKTNLVTILWICFSLTWSWRNEFPFSLNFRLLWYKPSKFFSVFTKKLENNHPIPVMQSVFFRSKETNDVSFRADLFPLIFTWNLWKNVNYIRSKVTVMIIIVIIIQIVQELFSSFKVTRNYFVLKIIFRSIELQKEIFWNIFFFLFFI